MIKNKHDDIHSIIVTSTQVFEQFIVDKFLGYITTAVVRGLNFVTDASVTITSVLGGRNCSIEDLIELSFNEAIDIMRLKAKKLKADAIINFTLDYNIEEFNFCGSVLVVVAEGVAVELIRRPGQTLTSEEGRKLEEKEGLIGDC